MTSELDLMVLLEQPEQIASVWIVAGRRSRV
jgi:hypothetical protein